MSSERRISQPYPPFHTVHPSPALTSQPLPVHRLFSHASPSRTGPIAAGTHSRPSFFDQRDIPQYTPDERPSTPSILDHPYLDPSPFTQDQLIQVRLPYTSSSPNRGVNSKDYQFPREHHDPVNQRDSKDHFISVESVDTHTTLSSFAFSPFSPVIQHRSPSDPVARRAESEEHTSTANNMGQAIRKFGSAFTAEKADATTDFKHEPSQDLISTHSTHSTHFASAQQHRSADSTSTTESASLPTVEWPRRPSSLYQPIELVPLHEPQAARYDTTSLLRDASIASADPLSDTRYAQTRPTTAPPTPPFGTSKTKEFSLDPPPYTDGDIPLPEPYNSAYPHPLSAYASLGVNEETRKRSGYDQALWELFNTNPAKLRGTILSEAGRDDLLPPALTMLIFPGEGNGIPERLWSRFESFGAARVPVGVAGMPQHGLSSATSNSGMLPPRLASLSPSGTLPSVSSTISAYGNLSAHPSLASSQTRPFDSPGVYTPTGSISIKGDDYFSTPQKDTRQNASVISMATPPSTRRFSANLGPSSPATPSASIASLTYKRVQSRNSADISPLSTKNTASPASYQSIYYKTELCRAWHEVGHCRYGEACQFAHGVHELRVPFESTVPPLTPPPEPHKPLYNQSETHRESPIQTSAMARYNSQALHVEALPHHRLDMRRASAPLSTVDERHELESSLFSSDIAPIGSGGSTKRSKEVTVIPRNGRSPDLATVAEWFSTRAKQESVNVSLDGMGVVGLGQRFAQGSTPQANSQTPARRSEPRLRLDIPLNTNHNNLASRTFASTAATDQASTQSTSNMLGSSLSGSISTSLSSTSQMLPTPLTASSNWIQNGLGVDVAAYSPSTSFSDSVLNSGSLGSAVGKRMARELQQDSQDVSGVQSLPTDGQDRPSKSSLSSTTWDFSTGNSIWC
ncbi:hypothetical protein BD324DRAFT_649018 [Kockovaella imperatae]|uniref:C3H1-type domain-containing protein n=1 Tax=Kockovaella imperatae TaxID=4999 RepID=A0A1Y1ULP8_9TREE|nr:hypothetical protein BD324DRAFT_649018 [Kockovaella imperatae]ORX38919.1 hypothetical protein BD324DRAFT_649018 [Kockovaella imperatae]